MRWVGNTGWAVAVICLASLAMADDTAATPIGKKVDNFTLPDFHGKSYALDDYKDKVVVLAFLGTECPLARIYAPRLRELAAEFEAQGVVFLGIDANLQDSLAEIGAFARINRMTFPMLKDNNNEVADRVGAVRTPEVFLLDRQRVIRYWGRIDNQYGFKTGAGYARPKLTERSLANAIGQVLAGKEVSQPVFKADGCFIGRVAKVAPHGEVTYSKQVARIFQNRCVGCHRAGEVAPFAMTSYDEVVGWAEAIREVVQEGRMPPWFADPRYGHFANDARLSDEEKQQIGAWVENGCPQGDGNDLPEPRQFAEGWQMGEPDQIVYMREKPHTVPADGAPQYRIYTVDPGWTTDQWIQATESRPGNRAVVHHIRVYVEPQNISDVVPRDGIGWYGPGFPPYICPPGTAIYVPANSKIEFWMHYTPNGTEQDDRSMIGIRFADPKTVKKMVSGPCMEYRGFTIPAGEPNYQVWADHVFLKDTLLLSLLPHMHLRGKNFRFEAKYPNGTSEVLLDVPTYDFNWQLRYIFAEPKFLPKGTRLLATAHYDNSADNLANPDPTKAVTWGQQTWDEMMEGLYTSIDAGQDVACLALVALSLTAGSNAARGPDLSGELKKLFDLGEQRTASAVAAAKAHYQQLKAAHAQDRRIDYAFALVLVNQQQYGDAIGVLSKYLEAGGGELNAHSVKMWAQVSAQGFAGVLTEARALADQFPQNVKSQPEERQPEEKYSNAARFLGIVFAYLELVRPDVVDAKIRSEDKKQILKRLGPMVAPDFAAGQQAVANRLSELKSQDLLTKAEATASKTDRPGAAAKDRGRRAEEKPNAHPITADSKTTWLSTYAPFPYEQEKRHVLSWFAK